jgi:predicted ester cyclase
VTCHQRHQGSVGAGFGKLIRDLKWDIKDVMVDCNRIIVRSEASGTPAGPFFGVPVSGESQK